MGVGYFAGYCLMCMCDGVFGRENIVSCPVVRFRRIFSGRGIMFEILGVLFEVGMVRMRETFFVFPTYRAPRTTQAAQAEVLCLKS